MAYFFREGIFFKRLFFFRETSNIKGWSHMNKRHVSGAIFLPPGREHTVRYCCTFSLKIKARFFDWGAFIRQHESSESYRQQVWSPMQLDFWFFRIQQNFRYFSNVFEFLRETKENNVLSPP